MKFKKTRIAVSVLCGILCLSLVAFWVRSYRMRDWLGLPGPGQAEVVTMRGTIELRYSPGRRLPRQIWWQHRSESSRRYDDLLDVPKLRLLASQHPDTSYFYGPHFGFAYDRSADGSFHNIYVQMWALATLLALAGLLPWIPWQPWPWHFSLKALLLLTTLIALILGKIIYVDPM